MSSRQPPGGSARPEAFALKILFTAVTIGAGFKGGEIVPTFFIGSTFGCVAGSLLGLDPGFAAAVGLIALFCGVVNSPIASIILSIELFGAQGLILFAIGLRRQLYADLATMVFTAAKKSCIPSCVPSILTFTLNKNYPFISARPQHFPAAIPLGASLPGVFSWNRISLFSTLSKYQPFSPATFYNSY